MKKFLNSARVLTIWESLQELAIALVLGALIAGPAVFMVYSRG